MDKRDREALAQEALEYDLEQSERSLVEWRGKMRASRTAQSQVIARNMLAFYEREVTRLREQLHTQRTR